MRVLVLLLLIQTVFLETENEKDMPTIKTLKGLPKQTGEGQILMEGIDHPLKEQEVARLGDLSDCRLYTCNVNECRCPAGRVSISGGCGCIGGINRLQNLLTRIWCVSQSGKGCDSEVLCCSLT